LLARDTENELESCLANLFSQKIPGGLEVIVLDSGSTQDEGMVIERLKEKYHRIRYIRSAREHRYATWNRGIKPARGRYLFLMEAHNRLRAGALVRLAEYLDGHPEVAMVWGDDESVKNPEAALLDEKEARFISRRPTKEAAFIEPNQVSPHLLWRSTLHQSLGLFDPTFEEAGYYEFALRIARVYPVHYVTGVVGAIQETREWEMDRKAILETELKQIRQFYQAIIETGKSQKPLPHPKPAPAISIILPTLGNLRLLTRALESVRQQTWTHYEVIVVNGSDTSLEDSIRASELDEKLRYIGLSSIPCRAVAWNAGLSLAAGRWVAFLHEEGAYYPNHLETLLEAARKSRQPIVYAGIHRLEGFFQGEDFVVTRSEQEAAQPFDAERLYVENFVQLQGMLAERTCLQQAGHFNPYMDPLSDWELMIRLARKFVFHPCEEITSELFCSPPWAGEILAHERIYRRYDELVENRPDIAKARQERLSELCRSALSAQQRSRRTDLRAQELASAT
jgi:glycosyltransferase involved in cell wall biosynthesis